MSEWPNNGGPVPPQGSDGSRPEATDEGLVPAGQTSRDNGRRPLSVTASVALCAIGGVIASSSMTLFAPVFVAYGLAALLQRHGLRDMALGLLAAIAAALITGVPQGTVVAVGSVIACLASALVAGIWVKGKVTAGLGCVIVAVVAAVSLGADAVLATLEGTTLSASVQGLLGAIQQQASEAPASVLPQVDLVSDLLSLLWPTSYVVLGLCESVAAMLGSLLATVPAPGESREVPHLALFDLPLWVVGVFVAAVAGIAVALTVPGVPELVLMVAANLAMAVRFALAAQGLAVLSWLMREKRVGALLKLTAWVVAFLLEVQFIVMTVVGLVDVWANFRHLTRGGGPDGADATKQDKEPASAG